MGKFPREGIEEKDVLASLALMEEMIGNQCMVKRRNNENAKLIAEEAALKVRETNKIRELYRILNEIQGRKRRKNCVSSKKLRKNGMNGKMF